MGDASSIQWTTRSWNPWQGCAKVSPGCHNCYMFRDMNRFGLDPEKVRRSAARTFGAPLRWQRDAAAGDPSRMVFLASWTDFFIADADEWRDEAWAIIRRCPDLIFQILTKRHGRIAAHLPADWGDGYPNVWLGVSAEDREWWDRRVSVLRGIPARTRFVSYEPALGSIEGASAAGIDWVIIGGESAPGRVFRLEWAREALAICRRDGAAPFMKQLGSYALDEANGIAGASLQVSPDVLGYVKLRLKDGHGGEMDEWPAELRVREFPP